MSALASELAAILGPGGWIAGDQAGSRARDWLDRYGAPPLGVARPIDAQAVAAVVKACAAHGASVTPQGGNTSMCGGAVPQASGAVILSLDRMSRMGAPDVAAGAVEVEAGCVLANVHAALDAHGLMLPMRLGSEGTAQIGGLIATNAGGSLALRYGMMSDLVLGLEVVLPNGDIWDGMRAVQKDNAGYALRRLFCGSEGTLGVITRASLRLWPAPRHTATCLLALPDVSAVIEMGVRLRSLAAEMLTGLEFFGETGLTMVKRRLPDIRQPLESPAPWRLLAELSAGSERTAVGDILDDALNWGLERGLVVDGTIAMSDRQRAEIWALRDALPEGQRLDGPQLKHDVSAPPGRLVEFLETAGAAVERKLPGARINAFGHLGDGNVHYNISPPAGAGFAGREAEMSLEIAGIVQGLGGSFAAEHGLGRSKVALADALRSPTERALMRRLKDAIDPEGRMNPGVIFKE